MDTNNPEPLYKSESNLKITGCRLGYILNFNNPKLEWKRVVR